MFYSMYAMSISTNSSDIGKTFLDGEGSAQGSITDL
jgi:hypothetical protein